MSPVIFYDRLPELLSIDCLSEELVLMLLPGGYRLGAGWFGQLEGAGHFEIWLAGRTGAELYRRNFGRDPSLVREMLDLILEMYTHATSKAQSDSARARSDRRNVG